MRHLISATLCALLLTAVCTTAQADVYRWKDAGGVWHYSDTPVPGAERVSGRAKPPVPRAATPAVASAARQPVETLPPPTSETANQVRQEVAQVRAEECKKAREAYDKSVRARRIYKTNEAGQRVYLNNAEADAARLAARSEMDSACAS